MKEQTPFKALKIGPDGWAHGVQIGQYTIDRPDSVLDPKAGPDAATEITEIITAEDCAAMIEAFRAGSADLLVDANHSSDLSDDTTAYAWVTDMRTSPDGLEVLLQLSDLGKAAVEGRRFRYLSPVFEWPDFRYDDETSLLGHPVRVCRFAFTNRPRMQGIRAVVNSSKSPAALASAASQQPALSQTPTKEQITMDYKAMLLLVLGLPDTATDEEIQTAVDAATAAKADADAETAMNAAGIPDDPAVRDGLKAAVKADKTAGCNAIAATAAALNAAKTAKPPAGQQRALHSEAGKTVPSIHAAAAAKTAARDAALNSVLTANPGMDRSLAFSQVRRNHPELF